MILAQPIGQDFSFSWEAGSGGGTDTQPPPTTDTIRVARMKEANRYSNYSATPGVPPPSLPDDSGSRVLVSANDAPMTEIPGTQKKIPTGLLIGGGIAAAGILAFLILR